MQRTAKGRRPYITCQKYDVESDGVAGFPAIYEYCANSLKMFRIYSTTERKANMDNVNAALF